jgi:hypothetical protein
MSDAQSPDPGAAAEQLAALPERSQRLVQAFWQRQAGADGSASNARFGPVWASRRPISLTQLNHGHFG